MRKKEPFSRSKRFIALVIRWERKCLPRGSHETTVETIKFWNHMRFVTPADDPERFDLLQRPVATGKRALMPPRRLKGRGCRCPCARMVQYSVKEKTSSADLSNLDRVGSHRYLSDWDIPARLRSSRLIFRDGWWICRICERKVR